MNPITGKEIHIQPGTVMKIQEFCKLTSSNYFNVANNDLYISYNYIIKFPDEYKDIADQFPDLFINKYNECLLFQNKDSRSQGFTYVGNSKLRTYEAHYPLGVYTLPQYMLTVCFASTWFHVCNAVPDMQYYSGLKTISCMHYPVEYNKNFNNVYDSVMIPNVHNKTCTVHYYMDGNTNKSVNDIVSWVANFMTFFKKSMFVNGNKIVKKFNKYVYDNVNPVVTDVYTVEDKAYGNEFCTVLGNNEMLVFDNNSQDYIHVA